MSFIVNCRFGFGFSRDAERAARRGRGGAAVPSGWVVDVDGCGVMMDD